MDASGCAALGVGREHEPATLVPDDVSPAVAAVLTEPGYRRGTGRVQAETADQPSVADTLERLLARPTPICSPKRLQESAKTRCEPTRGLVDPGPTQQALPTLEWVHRRENLVVCGPSGTGKTFLLEALGQHVVEQGLSVAWFTLEDVGTMLRRHRDRRPALAPRARLPVQQRERPPGTSPRGPRGEPLE